MIGGDQAKSTSYFVAGLLFAAQVTRYKVQVYSCHLMPRAVANKLKTCPDRLAGCVADQNNRGTNGGRVQKIFNIFPNACRIVSFNDGEIYVELAAANAASLSGSAARESPSLVTTPFVDTISPSWDNGPKICNSSERAARCRRPMASLPPMLRHNDGLSCISRPSRAARSPRDICHAGSSKISNLSLPTSSTGSWAQRGPAHPGGPHAACASAGYRSTSSRGGR